MYVMFTVKIPSEIYPKYDGIIQVMPNHDKSEHERDSCENGAAE